MSFCLLSRIMLTLRIMVFAAYILMTTAVDKGTLRALSPNTEFRFSVLGRYVICKIAIALA